MFPTLSLKKKKIVSKNSENNSHLIGTPYSKGEEESEE